MSARASSLPAPRALVVPGSINEVSALGDAVITEAVARTPWCQWPLVSTEDLFLIAAMNEALSPTAAFELVASYLAHLVETGDYVGSTVEKAGAQIARFVRYSDRRFGVTDVRDLKQEHVLAFVEAPVLKDELRAAGTRTRENRKWAVGLFFRTLRGLGLYEGDPLLDTARLPRPESSARPLLDAEIEECRKHALRGRHDTLGPVRLALAEAMAATSEIGEIEIADYDAEHGLIWLPGLSRRLKGRWSHLLPWEIEAVERRIAALGADAPRARLAYEGSGGFGRREAASATFLRKILNRVGLTRDREPRVRPSSIRAWGARRLYDETHDIQEVADRLGVRRLDNARSIIGLPAPGPDEPPPHRNRG
jgi:hypothetical protein